MVLLVSGGNWNFDALPGAIKRKVLYHKFMVKAISSGVKP